MEEQTTIQQSSTSRPRSSKLIYIITALACISIGFIGGYFYPKTNTQPSTPKSTIQSIPENLPPQAKLHMPVCIPQGPQGVRCHAQVVVNQKGKPDVTAGPVGYGPVQFQTAYGLNGLSAGGRIVAIVDAFDHPSIQSDLNTYSTAYGLPLLAACSGPIATSSIPCFQKVDQRGGTAYPITDSAWALETALDVETVHAVCPDCKILLVEADTNTFDSLTSAVDRAVALGATAVSNSYGASEFASQTIFDSHFNVPGIAFTASSGDSANTPTYPAASRFVTAVGGTTLALNSNNTYKTETAWQRSGSGCSKYETKPSWQTDRGCAMRTIADVSADADPSTGASVYNSVPYGGTGETGWFQVGGTSLASPIIAAVYALKGIPSQTQASSLPYANYSTTNFHDITSGGTGGCDKKNKYLCTTVNGYDAPTGLGTPKGIGAF